MHKKLILLIGISSSGKSSYAEDLCRQDLSFVELNRDNMRFSLFTNNIRNWQLYNFKNSNEKLVSKEILKIANRAVKDGKNCVCSDTNLNPKIRNKWYQWAKDNDYDVVVKEFPITFEEAIKRDKFRENSVGAGVLRKQYYKMQEYLGEYKYIPNESLPKAFICDIDGNVAICGERGFYDWEKVNLDKPRHVVIAMVHGLIEAGYTPIFMSGRDGICKDDTYCWILDNIMQWYLPENGGFHLFMREIGDMRKDYIVKKELFMKYVEKKFNVCAVLDDRPQVINLCWNDMGLPNVISTSDQLLDF